MSKVTFNNQRKSALELPSRSSSTMKLRMVSLISAPPEPLAGASGYICRTSRTASWTFESSPASRIFIPSRVYHVQLVLQNLVEKPPDLGVLRVVEDRFRGAGFDKSAVVDKEHLI